MIARVVRLRLQPCTTVSIIHNPSYQSTHLARVLIGSLARGLNVRHTSRTRFRHSHRLSRARPQRSTRIARAVSLSSSPLSRATSTFDTNRARGFVTPFTIRALGTEVLLHTARAFSSSPDILCEWSYHSTRIACAFSTCSSHACESCGRRTSCPARVLSIRVKNKTQEGRWISWREE